MVMTTNDLRDWVANQGDSGYYCQWCLTELAIADKGTPNQAWYCPNEMCLNDEQYYRLDIAEILGIDIADV